MGEPLTDREWLLHLADLLDEGRHVLGDPEGVHRVHLSAEFAQMIAARLRAIADQMGTERAKEWVRTKPEVEYDLGG